MFDTYLLYEYHFASFQLILAMLGMGATLRFADFIEVLRFPKGFILGLVCVLVWSPILAFTIAHLLELQPGIATGLVLISAVPGGTMSNVLTYFARGNVPLSISLTGVATAACLFTTPLILKIFSQASGNTGFEMPAQRIALEIISFLLVPLLLGMFLGARFDEKRELLSKSAIRASLAVIVIMVIGSAGAGRVDAAAYGGKVIFSMFIFCLLLLGTGYLLSLAIRLPSKDAIAVGIEAAYRNVSLAILIKASLFPAVPGVPDAFADQVFFVALLYGAFGIVVVVPAILLYRRFVAP